MNYKLIVVMDNGTKYEYFKPFNITNADDFVKSIKSLGFCATRDIYQKNYVAMGLSTGKNVIVAEDKVSSYEFVECK